MGIEVGMFLMSMAMKFISSEMQKMQTDKAEKDLKARTTDQAQEIKANTRGSVYPVKVIYGRHRIGGNNVYVNSGGVHRRELYYAQTLAEGPNKGIVDDEEGRPYIWFDDERIYSKYSGTYSYNEKTGTSTQIQNTIINTNISEFTDPMRYTAYTAWKLDFDEDKYRGIPNINYLYDGRLLYDFRNGTTSWSDNPVLALYDFFTNDRYGLGLDSSTIDTTSWEEVADYCETKEFKINMVVAISEDNVWAVVDKIKLLFRGELNYWNGIYYLRYRDLYDEVSQLTITDDHIVQQSNGKAMISVDDPGNYDVAKGLRVTFINDNNNQYSQDSFIIGDETGVIEEFNLKGCTDRQMAGKLGTSELENQQLNRTISGRFRDDCLLLEPNDIVTFNSTALNIADQTMRVKSTTYTNLGFIDLVLKYDDLYVYDDVYNVNPESIYSTTLPDPSLASLIENAIVTESTYTQRLRSFSKLNISFDIPTNSWFKHIEVLVSTDGDTLTNYKHQFNAVDDFSIDPVEEGETYYIILRTVNIWGTKQDVNQATKLSITVTGKSNTTPDSLTSLTAIPGNGSVSLRSTKLTDPDIEIYEFRVGDQWTGGIFLSAKRSPHEELSLVKPGSHTFWCNTRGTNNLYGDTPQDATVDVAVPKGWTSYTTFTDDYTDDTNGQQFENVEHLTYSSNDYLKCSHGTDSTSVDSFLNGYYVSEEFDTGVVADTYYTYLETEFVTVGAGTTWGDIFPDSTATTWAALNLDSRSWKDIFEIDEAPQVTIRIWYKAESTHDWSYIENAQILAGVIYGRYFKVEINITDPAINVNAYVKEFTLKLYN